MMSGLAAQNTNVEFWASKTTWCWE